jgi:hypothetical protein
VKADGNPHLITAKPCSIYVATILLIQAFGRYRVGLNEYISVAESRSSVCAEKYW